MAVTLAAHRHDAQAHSLRDAAEEKTRCRMCMRSRAGIGGLQICGLPNMFAKCRPLPHK